MKYISLLLILFFLPLKNNQQFSFLLQNDVDLVELWHQPPSNIKDILGKPSNVKYSKSKVDILTYYTRYTYQYLGLEITFSGKRKKEHRKVCKIVLNTPINDTIWSKKNIILMYGRPKFLKSNEYIYNFEKPRIRVDMCFKNEFLDSLILWEY